MGDGGQNFTRALAVAVVSDLLDLGTPPKVLSRIPLPPPPPGLPPLPKPPMSLQPPTPTEMLDVPREIAGLIPIVGEIVEVIELVSARGAITRLEQLGREAVMEGTDMVVSTAREHGTTLAKDAGKEVGRHIVAPHEIVNAVIDGLTGATVETFLNKPSPFREILTIPEEIIPKFPSHTVGVLLSSIERQKG